jgi:uncharacterized protein (DUF305 family)
MYPDKRMNRVIGIVSILVLIACYFFIRKQTTVSDKQFLRSMIPHHAAAILMVRETTLEDTEVRKLGEDIISAQQKEIEFMKAKLKELENK